MKSNLTNAVNFKNIDKARADFLFPLSFGLSFIPTALGVALFLVLLANKHTVVGFNTLLITAVWCISVITFFKLATTNRYILNKDSISFKIGFSKTVNLQYADIDSITNDDLKKEVKIHSNKIQYGRIILPVEKYEFFSKLLEQQTQTKNGDAY